MVVVDFLQHLFWRVVIYPFFPILLPSVGSLPFIRKYGPYAISDGRQDYLLGRIAPGRSPQELVEHLAALGFRNHFISWRNNGEIASLRRLERLRFQYHVRVFEDGEVRTHYEYTPECRPFRHLRGIGVEERREEFLALLGDWIETKASGRLQAVGK